MELLASGIQNMVLREPVTVCHIDAPSGSSTEPMAILCSRRRTYYSSILTLLPPVLCGYYRYSAPGIPHVFRQCSNFRYLSGFAVRVVK